MKYAVRAIKYFLYFIILLVILMAILVVAGIVEADVSAMFRNGYDSLWQIAVMFACVSAVYPYFGFMKKDTVIPGEYADIRDTLIKYMEEKGYSLENEDDEKITFRYRSIAKRITNMYEDRITFYRQLGGFKVEGLRKIVVRLVYGLEAQFRNEQ